MTPFEIATALVGLSVLVVATDKPRKPRSALDLSGRWRRDNERQQQWQQEEER